MLDARTAGSSNEATNGDASTNTEELSKTIENKLEPVASEETPKPLTTMKTLGLLQGILPGLYR